jgi:hypothetical protein
MNDYSIKGTGEDTKVILPEGNILTLSRLDIEAIGLKKSGENFDVVLITSISVKKVQADITDKLELVGFHFSNLKKAIAFKDLLILALWGSGHKI